MKILDLMKYRVRKLTPNEYGKLQGFPMDGWHQVVSDTQAYKQFGNSVVVPLMERVAELVVKKIEELDDTEKVRQRKVD